MNLWLVLVLLMFSGQSSRLDVRTVRDMYAKAVESKTVARNLLDQLEQAPKSPVMKGYLGATTMLQAKHVMNPFTKLSYFNSGKKILETALDSAPQNVELRFLRYGIQRNVPAFLNYRSQREADRAFLLKSLREGKVKDAHLKGILQAFLKQQGDL